MVLNKDYSYLQCQASVTSCRISVICPIYEMIQNRLSTGPDQWFQKIRFDILETDWLHKFPPWMRRKRETKYLNSGLGSSTLRTTLLQLVPRFPTICWLSPAIIHCKTCFPSLFCLISYEYAFYSGPSWKPHEICVTANVRKSKERFNFETENPVNQVKQARPNEPSIKPS